MIHFVLQACCLQIWIHTAKGQTSTTVGGGFKYCLFSPLFGEDSNFDSFWLIFIRWVVQPPTSLCPAASSCPVALRFGLAFFVVTLVANGLVLRVFFPYKLPQTLGFWDLPQFASVFLRGICLLALSPMIMVQWNNYSKWKETILLEIHPISHEEAVIMGGEQPWTANTFSHSCLVILRKSFRRTRALFHLKLGLLNRGASDSVSGDLKSKRNPLHLVIQAVTFFGMVKNVTFWGVVDDLQLGDTKGHGLNHRGTCESVHPFQLGSQQKWCFHRFAAVDF